MCGFQPLWTSKGQHIQNFQLSKELVAVISGLYDTRLVFGQALEQRPDGTIGSEARRLYPSPSRYPGKESEEPTHTRGSKIERCT